MSGSYLIREVEFCELAEMLFGRLVISLCGLCLGIERAEIYSFAADHQHRLPRPSARAVRNTFVYREAFRPSLSIVPAVLLPGGGPEIGLAIVEAVAVDMVALEAVGNIGNLAMHTDCFSPFAFFGRGGPDGIKFIVNSRSGPFILAQPVIVVRIDDGEFALGQGYLPEGVAVAQQAV